MRYSDKDVKEAEKIYKGSHYQLSDKKALEKLLFAKNVYKYLSDELGKGTSEYKELSRLVSTYKSQMGIDESNLKLKLKQIYEEIEPSANASANSLILMDKLAKSPKVMQMLQQIDLPTDQYKAIIRFAALLGIPEQRFTDFCQQQNNITKQGQ